MSGKGSRFRKVNRGAWDVGYIRAYGYCNQHSCPRSTYCWRYTERIGRNNVSYVPIPEKYDDCEWYKPAPCRHCNQTGYLNDWCGIQKKWIKTTCMFCKDGRLVYEKKETM